MLPILRKAFGLSPQMVASHEDLREVEKILREQCVTIFQVDMTIKKEKKRGGGEMPSFASWTG